MLRATRNNSHGRSYASYQKALTAAQAGKFKALIVYAPTRLGRDVGVTRELRDGFAAADVTIHTTITGASDPESESSFIMDSTQDMLSEAESRRLSRRFKAGKQQAAKEGSVQVSTPPFGYRRIRKDDKTTLEINQTESTHVIRIFESYAAGIALAKIVRDLNKEKVPKRRPGKWLDSTVRSLLENPTYFRRVDLWTNSIDVSQK